MATLGQIIFYSMIAVIILLAAVIILILCLTFSNPLTEVTSRSTKPIANLGKDELLSCYLHTVTFQDRFTQVRITWEKKEQDRDQLVYLHENGAPALQNQAEQFRGRVHLFPEVIPSANASLMLRSVKRSDEGEYTCSISSSSGGGKVNIQLRTAAFSTPTFTFANGTLTAKARRWFPKPNITWMNETGDSLNGSTSFTESSTGIFSIVSTLEHQDGEIYTLRIENNLVIDVTEATVIGSTIKTSTYFTFNAASSLIVSAHLSIVISVICIYYVT
ncbi:V-set domain-containing T-cell activation inhibitor 1 [Pholidichthys leucotaenia]